MKNYLTFILLCIFINAKGQLSVTFTVTDASCNGKKDGAIIANPSGGTSPYTYQWSANAAATTQTITGLGASYYQVLVTDAMGATVTNGTNVNEPTKLDLTSHYSVDCSVFRGSDGSATIDPSGSVPPYTYSWKDGPTYADRYQMAAGGYEVTVIDAHGCANNQQFIITEPTPDLWLMTGNSSTDPDNQFIGSTDQKDVLFKTNSIERFRMSSSGNLSLASDLHMNNKNIVFGDNTVISYSPSTETLPSILTFSILPFIEPSGVPSDCVPWLNVDPLYRFNGSIQLFARNSSNVVYNMLEMGSDGAHGIIEATGTTDNGSDPTALLINYYCGKDVYICTDGIYNNHENGNIQLGGSNCIVGIGINPSSVNSSNPYRLYVVGGIRTEKAKVDLQSNWPDYVFEKNYPLRSLKDIEQFLLLNKHLPDMPTGEEVKENGIDLGEMQTKTVKQVEEIYLQLFELKKEINSLAEENTELKKQIQSMKKK